jgi:hypothetical protein
VRSRPLGAESLCGQFCFTQGQHDRLVRSLMRGNHSTTSLRHDTQRGHVGRSRTPPCLASPFRLDRLAFPEHNTLRPLERHTVRGKPVAPRCSAMALQIARAVRVFLLDKRTPLIARLTQQCLSSTGSSATHRSPPSFGLSGPARRHHYHQDDRHSRALGAEFVAGTGGSSARFSAADQLAGYAGSRSRPATWPPNATRPLQSPAHGALGTFTEGFATADLLEARDVLDSC